MIFKKIIFSPVFLFFAQAVIAQGVASVKASVDKNRILIGEPLLLTIEIYSSPGSAKELLSLDSIDHFEFLEKPKIDTTGGENGLNTRGVYKITSFDSGHWVIPAFVLSPGIKTDTIPVDVVFSEFDPNQPYHDIKDILEVKPQKKNDWWYMAAGGLLLLLLLVYLLMRKKPRPVQTPGPPVNPYEEAKKQLAQLQSEKPPVKQYYSRLTDIFRLYVFRKKNILSLQKTTDDLVIQLRSLDLGKEQFDKLSQSLRLADFVKFAKYIPSDQDNQVVFDSIRQSIEEIERLS